MKNMNYNRTIQFILIHFYHTVILNSFNLSFIRIVIVFSEVFSKYFLKISKLYKFYQIYELYKSYKFRLDI